MRLTALAFVLTAILAAPAAAQMTIPFDEPMLATHCTAGPELIATQRHADGVIAKHGDPAEMSQFMLRASSLAQKCAAETGDAGARDWYRFFEANDSFQSALSMNDVGTRWPPALKTLKALSTDSAVPAVRAAALQATTAGMAAMKLTATDPNAASRLPLLR